MGNSLFVSQSPFDGDLRLSFLFRMENSLFVSQSPFEGAANLLWPVLKVLEAISAIGCLNAFDTNGVRPLYPPPP